MKNELRLKGRVALVTGAGRGIGRAIALKYAEEGAQVIVNDIQSSYAASTARRIMESGGEAVAVQADVSRLEEVMRIDKLAKEKYGHIDMLVNNAGVRKDAVFSAMKPAFWDNVIETTLRGSYNCSSMAQKYMMRQGCGKILNIASPAPPSIAGKGNVSYSAANFGLIGFTKALSIELGPYNINVNCIAPDFIDTGMTRTAGRAEGLYLDDLKKFAVAAIPLRRLGKPEDVSGLALFLVSDEADFITGQVIYVKGGP